MTLESDSDKIIEEFVRTGQLNPIAMASLAQRIFENPSDENLEILQEIVSKVDQVDPNNKQIEENNFSILGPQENEDPIEDN